MNTDGRASFPHQAAAWQLLNRIAPGPELKNRLERSPDATGLVTDLKAAATDLHVWPRNKEEILWLTYLRDPARQELWNRFKTAVSRLSPDQRQGLQLRHLPVLDHLPPWIFRLGRQGLVARLETSLLTMRRGITKRASATATQGHDGGDIHLCWADLATVGWLTDALEDRSLIDAWFAQADADRVDTRTEYGGVLDVTESRPTAHLYPPDLTRHDRVFQPPQRMIEHLYTAIAYYHFHAQSYQNGDFAHPGGGDLKAADRLNANFLVLTFVDPDQLNVDYYQSNGVVIDLGMIRR